MGELLNQLQFKVFMSCDNFGGCMTDVLGSEFKLEKNHVMDLSFVTNAQWSSRVRSASKKDLATITDLLLTDDVYKNTYTRKSLLTQLISRYDDKFSRCFVLTINDNIVASYSTYGETDDFAMVSGLIVRPENRKQGYATELAQHICAILNSEGKKGVCLIRHTNTPSFNMHKKLGAVPSENLFKYIRC